MKKKYCYFTLLFIVCSCSNERDLGNNYYYLPEYESMDGGYPYGSIIYKGPDEYIYNEIIIFSDVEKVIRRDEYVLALQKPNVDLFKKYLIERVEKIYANNFFSLNFLPKQDLEFLKSEIYAISKEFDPNLSYEVAVINLIEKSKYLKHIFDSKLNYYIIESQDDIVVGPLNVREFRNECKTRNLPVSDF